MGLNALGLGIILSMRDMASVPAQRAAGALGQLDSAAQKFSLGFNSAMATAFEGMNLLSAGLLVAGAPALLVKSTLETQAALSNLSVVGIKDLGLLQNAARQFSNTWAGATQKDFIETAYQIKSGVFSLTDAAVAKFTASTGLIAKAAKSNIKEMTDLMPIMYAILRDTQPDDTDLQFIDKLTAILPESAAIYRTTAKWMADAFSQFGGLGTRMGVSMQEQFAVLGQLQQTMTGSEAGTKFRAFIRSTARAQSIAKKMKIPIEFEASDGMMLPIWKLLENIKNQFGDKLTLESTETLRKLFGSREAVNAIALLLPVIDTLKKDTGTLFDSMQLGEKRTMEMALMAANNIGEGWQVMVQRLNNLTQSAGEALIPMFRPIFSIFGTFVIFLQEVAKKTPFVIQLVSAFSMLVGTLLIVTGALFIMSAAFKIVNASMILMKSRLSLLKTEFIKLMVTMWPFIVLAGLMYIAFKTNFLGIRDFATNSLEKLKDFFNKVSKIWTGLKELMGSLMDNKGTISEETRKMLDDAGLWEITKNVFMLAVRLNALWDGMKQGFSGFFGVIESVLKPIGYVFKEYILKPIDWVLTKMGIVVPFLKALISPNANNLNTWNKVGVVLGWISGILVSFGLVTRYFMPIITVGIKIFNLFKGIGTFLLKFGRILWTIGGYLAEAFVAVAAFVAGILGIPVWVAGAIIAAVIALVVAIIVYWDKVKEFFIKLGEGIKTTFFTIVDDVKSGITSFFGWFGDKIQGFIDKIKELKNSFVDFINGNGPNTPLTPVMAGYGYYGVTPPTVSFSDKGSKTQSYNGYGNYNPNKGINKTSTYNNNETRSNTENKKVTIEVPVHIDGKKVGKAIAEYVDDERRR